MQKIVNLAPRLLKLKKEIVQALFYPVTGWSQKIMAIQYSANYLKYVNASNQSDMNRSALVGGSRQHWRLLKQIDRIRNASASVLVTGESGTGKEVVAKELYRTSNLAASGRFEAINCGAIPEGLLESELFGHCRGAFTDAKVDKKGLFEVCSGGVLFLDEIGEMPLQLQVKLLRVLQEKEIRPLGSNKTVRINTRVIAATNRDLLKEVEQGRFRLDLYYRISVLKIHIPPLRERAEDIKILTRYFIDKLARDNQKSIAPLSDEELQRVALASWPGNVRELQNAIERAVVLADDGVIDLSDLLEEDTFGIESSRTLKTADLDEIPFRHSEAKQVFEERYLTNLLRHTKGNVTEAAKLAEKTRVEIYRYLARNDIAPRDFRVLSADSPCNSRFG